ncbi:MAG: polyprenyl synthetase family protein [Chloroflexi bacterium]|nr:polyprenyl synthetase family protein [Chloroflexota bacterium]
MSEIEKVSLLRGLANLVANEVGRQTKSVGLPDSLAATVRRQMDASGVSVDADEPSAFGLLVLLSYEAAGGRDPIDAGPAAAAIQFLISAGDVLDDIQDGDPVSSLDAQDSSQQSELVACLLALSHASMASLSPRKLTARRILGAFKALSTLQLAALAGQHRDVEISVAEVAGVERAEAIIAAKSGSLGRAAAETGARLATDDSDALHQIGYFGMEWAITAQALNDVAGVWPGGTEGTDIVRGRLTLPVALGLGSKSADSELVARLGDLISRAGADASAEREARALLHKSGAIHKAWAYAAVHHARAAAIARTIEGHNPQSKLQLLLRN